MKTTLKMIAVEILNMVENFWDCPCQKAIQLKHDILDFNDVWYNSFGPGNYRNALEVLDFVIWYIPFYNGITPRRPIIGRATK